MFNENLTVLKLLVGVVMYIMLRILQYISQLSSDLLLFLFYILRCVYALPLIIKIINKEKKERKREENFINMLLSLYMTSISYIFTFIYYSYGLQGLSFYFILFIFYHTCLWLYIYTIYFSKLYLTLLQLLFLLSLRGLGIYI